MLHPSAAACRASATAWGDLLMTRSTLQQHAAARLSAAGAGARRSRSQQARRSHSGSRRRSGSRNSLKDVYEFLRDMSLLIATGGVAYIANVFQKRHSFIEALKEEWRDIIAAKSALFAYTQLERPTLERVLSRQPSASSPRPSTTCARSTRTSARPMSWSGLYPYAPLHDMRRALQTLEPRKNPDASERGAPPRARCHPAGFYALRERFLEELDLEPPDHPLLLSGGRRTKSTGTHAWHGPRGDQRSSR